MGVEPTKNRDIYILPPKMDGENNGTPYEQMDDWVVFPLFLETPIYFCSTCFSLIDIFLVDAFGRAMTPHPTSSRERKSWLHAVSILMP